MHSLLATLCAAALALPVPIARASVGPAASGESAEKLYEDGRKDFRLGRFAAAIDKWERAYAIAELPLLLYNIALAYRKLYGVSNDVADLRKGKVVLENFFVLAERDPEVDASDARLLMQEIDKLIAEAGEEPDPTEPTNFPADDGDLGPTDRPTPSGDDPGRTLRIAGAATMGAGGVFVVTGVALAVVFGIRGSEFKSDLDNAQQLEENGGQCRRADGQPTECRDAIDTARSNGRRANLGMGLALGLGGGLGLAALATGAVLFVQGNRKSKEWRGDSARVRVAPSLPSSSTGLGLTITGRF
jgi:hypothetical protein